MSFVFLPMQTLRRYWPSAMRRELGIPMDKAIRFGAVVLIFLLTLCACDTVTVEKHVSLANGGLSATNGNQIYFVQEDGIYVAGMDMSNPTLLVEQSDITQLAVNDGYVAYAVYRYDPSPPLSSYVCDVFVLRKTDGSVVQRYACQSCESLYLVDARLYFVGYISEDARKEAIENGSIGLYIMDFEQSDRIQTIRKNDCVRLLDDSLLLFEDQYISYNEADRLLFAKGHNHNTESLGYRSYNTIYCLYKRRAVDDPQHPSDGADRRRAWQSAGTIFLYGCF